MEGAKERLTTSATDEKQIVVGLLLFPSQMQTYVFQISPDSLTRMVSVPKCSQLANSLSHLRASVSEILERIKFTFLSNIVLQFSGTGNFSDNRNLS